MGGRTGLSGSKSCSSWVAASRRGKRRTWRGGAGPGGCSHFHFPAIPAGLGWRWQCERGCHCLTQHVPKPQESCDVFKKLTARSYQIRGISRSFLHCLDSGEEVLLCPCISLSLSAWLPWCNSCDLTASNTKQRTIQQLWDLICKQKSPHCQMPIV